MCGVPQVYKRYRPVQKADAIRPYIMKHIGGGCGLRRPLQSRAQHTCACAKDSWRLRSCTSVLAAAPFPFPHQRPPAPLCPRNAGLYLDSDTECWREGSDMLEGHDLVLQVRAYRISMCTMYRRGGRYAFWSARSSSMRNGMTVPQGLAIKLTGIVKATNDKEPTILNLKLSWGVWLVGDGCCPAQFCLVGGNAHHMGCWGWGCAWEVSALIVPALWFPAQGHHGTEALANGMMASVPGHPFWDHTIGLMKQRTGVCVCQHDVKSSATCLPRLQPSFQGRFAGATPAVLMAQRPPRFRLQRKPLGTRTSSAC